MNIDTTKLKTLSAAMKRRFGWLGFVIVPQHELV